MITIITLIRLCLIDRIMVKMMFTGCYTGSLRCSFLQPEMRGKFNGDLYIVVNDQKCLSYPNLITILLLTNTIVTLMLMLTT